MHITQLMALTPDGWPRPAMARAAMDAGAIGVVNGAFAADGEPWRTIVDALAGRPRNLRGLRLDLTDDAAPGLLRELAPAFGRILLAARDAADLPAAIAAAHHAGTDAFVEVQSREQARRAAECGADALIAKGNEAGGWVAAESTPILLQRILQAVDLPVWAQGGMGRYTAAAAMAAGAAGVVLDGALLLMPECELPADVRDRVGRMDGTETVCLGDELELPLRVMAPIHSPVVADLRARAAQAALEPVSLRRLHADWARCVHRAIGWGPSRTHLWPLGQDAALARPLAERYASLPSALRGLRAAIAAQARVAAQHRLLSSEAPWARIHGTRLPLAQGPMTRVSDTPRFAAAVADAGGLPFLALGQLAARDIAPMLDNAQKTIPGAWGVGLLGFLGPDAWREQCAAVCACRPPFALIAGGRPDQARQLDAAGTETYLHVPSPGLLKLFLEDGARRFVFEGRECGGHVGPLSSFVLWSQAIDVLLETLPAADLSACRVMLAGGIHDACSASMAATVAAPLAEQGVPVGFLMGTAYLFTEEAVSTGAILKSFQQEALRCGASVLLETGPGHVVRCAPTPYARTFADVKARLRQTEPSSAALRAQLETMNIGRLRLAAKGVVRADGAPGAVVPASAKQRHADGLYMIGQAAGLHKEIDTVNTLHSTIRDGGTEHLRNAMDAPPSPPRSTDVAIVGMSCLLPGAAGIAPFWRNILNRVDCIREIPASRWDWRLYFDPDRAADDRITSRWGGFLDPIVFDPTLYGMPPRSLASIEPVQLLALEAARAAFADAGFDRRPFPREETAVVIGASGGLAELGQSYVLRSALINGREDNPSRGTAENLPAWTEDSFAGILLNVIAGRIANRFNLGGPSFAVDAACASSLAAVYLACAELTSGACDAVLAGGVDTFQTPFNYLCFSKTHALSPRGRCRTFDHEADGTCISEGVSMLVLKRLDDAERDGDRVYAVIKGVGASSDGKAKGMTAPSPRGQARALRRAYAQAGFSPASLGLVEAHGTGTVAGDRAEIESLRDVVENAGAPTDAIAIGSVKSMIGHSKGAAGITGMIKVALALRHRVLPPTLGVERPNRSLDGAALYANTQTRPWIARRDGQPRRGAVSAFGFGGANYHAVLEEAPGAGARAAAADWPHELLVWRAASSADLLRRTASLREALRRGARPELNHLAFTLWREAAVTPAPAACTLALVVSSRDDLAAKLDAVIHAAEQEAPPPWDERGIYRTQRPLAGDNGPAFLFPGQGSHRPGMLRELALHFAEVRGAFEDADRILADRFERPLSGFVFPPPRYTPDDDRSDREALTATHVAQPALGAAAVGVHRLLSACGIAPAFTAGHSYGEYAALYAANCLTAEDLFRASEARGRFIVEEARGDLGTMAAVAANEEQTRALVGDLAELWVANLNSPRQTIISGTRPAIEAALERLAAANVAAQTIPVACAFHSPLVEPARQRLEAFLGDLPLRPPTVPVFSNAAADRYPDDPDGIRKQLGAHLVSPVRFVAEIEALYAAGARLFVEAGPGNVLSRLVDRILGDREHLTVPIETRERQGLEAWLHALGQLAAHGAPINLDRLFEGRETRAYDLADLVAETREPVLPPTAWHVDGGHAWPADADTRPAPYWTARATALGDAATATPAASAENAPTPPGPDASTDPTGETAKEILAVHERVMQQVMDGHRRVMMAALGGPAPDAERAVTATEAPPRAVTAPPEDRDAAGPTPAVEPATSSSATDVAATATAEPEEPEEAPREADADGIQAAVLSIVADRTGYPPDLLDLDADLEADLGIDSIKRVEIAGQLRRSFPQLGASPEASAAGNLATRRTLRDLLDAVAGVMANNAVSHDVEPGPAVREATPDPAPATDERPLARFLLKREDSPPRPASVPLPADGTFVITDDGHDAATRLAEQIRDAGGRAVVVSPPPLKDTVAKQVYEAAFMDPEAIRVVMQAIRKAEGRIAGIIHLLPLSAATGHAAEQASRDGWKQTLQRHVKSLFYLVQAAAADLKSEEGGSHARVLAAVDTDAESLIAGGLTGLVNSIAAEWPGRACRVVSLDPADSRHPPAAVLLRELRCGDGERFVAYRGPRVQRMHIVRCDLPADRPAALSITRQSVLLVTGGARGITAQVAIELAERFQPTLILAGRTPWPQGEEPPDTRTIQEPVALRRILAARLSSSERAASLADVEAAYRRLVSEREVAESVARMRAAGSEVVYLQADVREEARVKDLLESIRARYGRLDGVIHGVGVVEDQRIEEKQPDSFDRVFDTKVDSAHFLTRYLPLKELQFVAFFSSSSVLGNGGQCDYSAANGVLNAMARRLRQRMDGRAVALMWGPWQGAGMASADIRRRLREKGVQIIAPAAGRRAFLDELQRGTVDDAEVLLGDGPYRRHDESAHAMHRVLPLVNADALIHNNGIMELAYTLDPERDLYLNDHRLDGQRVLPAAMAMEFMAEAAWIARPPQGEGVTITDLDVLQGIRVQDEPLQILIRGQNPAPASPGASPDGIAMQIVRPETPRRPNYRATVALDGDSPPAAAPLDAPELSPFPLTVRESYDQWLFQGPAFAGITDIRGIGKKGIAGRLHAVNPETCLPPPAGGQWLIDPTVVDASLQLVILWERHWFDRTPLPMHIGRFRLYESLSGGPVECTVIAGATDDGEALHADIYYHAPDGRLLAVMQDLRCACTRELNRLSTASAAGRPV